MSANGLADEAVTQLRIARNQVAPEAPPQNAAAIDNALSALSVYIPAEAMALYLAISSSLPVITETFPGIDSYHVYWSFVWGVSPGLFLLAYFVKLARTNAGFPNGWEFPYFRLAASIIAFGFWGRCVPGNPFAHPNEKGAVVLYGILATLLSIVLPSTEAIYNWVLDLYRKRPAKTGTRAGNATAHAALQPLAETHGPHPINEKTQELSQ